MVSASSGFHTKLIPASKHTDYFPAISQCNHELLCGQTELLGQPSWFQARVCFRDQRIRTVCEVE